MTNDPYCSGLSPDADLAWVGPMEGAPQLVETFNLWLNDGPRGLCVNLSPHLERGELVRASAMLFLPGGRILRRHNGDTTALADSRRFGTPYVQYECIEPFRRWTYRIDNAEMRITNDAELAYGEMPADGPTALVSAELNLTTRSPAWIMGGFFPEVAERLAGPAGLWMGSRFRSGPSPDARRYEQLAEATGTITVDGQVYEFSGTGMRAHVRGERELSGMRGHFWTAALFSSGRGFAMVGYQDPGGAITYDEGYLMTDGRVHPARITAAPPMDRNPLSAPFTYDFTSETLGTIQISGRDTSSFVWSQQRWVGIGSDQMRPRYALDPTAPLVMKQSPAEFVWDGEFGWGLREISGEMP